jgi:hypothetical protein
VRRTKFSGQPNIFFGHVRFFLGGAEYLQVTRIISWEVHKICWTRAQLFGRREHFFWERYKVFWTSALYSGHAHNFSVQHTIFWEVNKIFWIRV